MSRTYRRTKNVSKQSWPYRIRFRPHWYLNEPIQTVWNESVRERDLDVAKYHRDSNQSSLHYIIKLNDKLCGYRSKVKHELRRVSSNEEFYDTFSDDKAESLKKFSYWIL